ncbi:hypothetical protein chiPu_0017730 [Chiloscyllium punctatum]|uniref:Uncharacterized protein n=1 Tax=Chiloscyllium punctatum TaxID=137246 RepID=A0A401RIE7_CHIPU|nr:hypothetical protein [Chiloscyllium punctatum]
MGSRCVLRDIWRLTASDPLPAPCTRSARAWGHPLARSRAPAARGTAQKPLERRCKKHKLRQLLDRAVDVPIDVRSERINKQLRRANSAARARAESGEDRAALQ